jgi:mRNA interferase RelE/StbE
VTGPQRRVTIQWTTTAKECLAALPPKVRRGILEKADALYNCTDPKGAHKPLGGPLDGYYRICYSRYRAVYTVEEEAIANGDVLIHVTIRFVAAGIRKEHSKDDVYRVAQKLVEMHFPDVAPDDDDDEESSE